jgi:hypothetical protein
MTYAEEIKALCEAAKRPELAAGFIAEGKPVAEVIQELAWPKWNSKKALGL